MPLNDWDITDLQRRLANLITFGSISQVNYQNAKARVKIGEIETTWLPWVMRDGNDKNWHGIDVGEQIIILAPSGDLNQGIILPSICKSQICQDGDLYIMKFEDGSVINFNRKTGNLMAEVTGDATIKVQKSLIAESGKAAKVKAPEITLDGEVTITGSLLIQKNLTTSGTVSLSGGVPVARLGDEVSVDANTHKGTITTGSAISTTG